MQRWQNNSSTRAWRRSLAALTVLAVVVGALIVLLSRPPAPEPRRESAPPLTELSRANLILKDNRLHRAGDPTPFTGLMVEHYADGTLRSRSAVSNGLLHGLSQGWYTNGHRQVEEHFRAGVSDGLRTKWYVNGNLLSTVTIVDGKLEGTFTRWRPDGSLAEQVKLKHGQPDGLSRAYYSSGFLKAEARVVQGNVVERKSWQDGERRERSLVASNPRAGSGH